MNIRSTGQRFILVAQLQNGAQGLFVLLELTNCGWIVFRCSGNVIADGNRPKRIAWRDDRWV